MGRVKRLIRLFEGGVTSLKRVTRRSLFKSGAKPRWVNDLASVQFNREYTGASAVPPGPTMRAACSSGPRPGACMHATCSASRSVGVCFAPGSASSDTAGACRAAKDHLHRTAQSAKAPLFRRKTAPAAPEPKPAKAPKRRPPAKAPAPVLAAKRAVVTRQGPKVREHAVVRKRPAWDFGEVQPREALEVAVQIGSPSPDSLQLHVQPRWAQQMAPLAPLASL
jgi:hypothetical protein